MDLKESDILGDAVKEHWYYKTKMKAVRRYLVGERYSRVLDVGAGSGFFSRGLLAQSDVSQACCVDISYLQDSDTTHMGKPLLFRRSIDQADTDLVLLMDVLEHVDDDVALLNEYVEKVPSGTRFLISVPAFKLLWSEHDVFLEHKRRYRLSQVEEVVKSSGLNIKQSSYYFGAVFPIAVTIRLAHKLVRGSGRQPRSQLTRHHPLVNAVLEALSSIELMLFRYNRIAGLTVFCLAEKP